MTKSVYILLALFLIFISYPIAASSLENNPEEKRWSENIYYGISLGFQLGQINRYEVAPIIGYKFTPAWSVGLGARYNYYRDKRFEYNIKSHIYGGSIFSDLVVIPDLGKVLPFRMLGSLFLHGEIELLNLPAKDFDEENYPDQTRFWKPGYLLGAGLRQSTGKRSWLYFVVLYNLNDSKRLPYDNPFIRFGFVF